VNILTIAAPYAAVAMFLGGTIWRFRNESSISARSSQMLEGGALAWGTVPFHFGIVVLFFFHLLPLLIPDTWRTIVSSRIGLRTVESVGLAAALLCLAGLFVLLVRRVSSSAVRAGSGAADVLVLAILVVQVTSGIAVATMHRWGAVWSLGTTVPYLRSLVMFRPDPSFIAGIPPAMLWHLAGAWIVLALLPFTRLIHMLTLPLGYLTRPPQKVVWTTRKPA
jgi:nitrate reductase gamma subunit